MCASDALKAQNSVAVRLVSRPCLPRDTHVDFVRKFGPTDEGVLNCRYEGNVPSSAVAWVSGVVPDLPRDEPKTLGDLQDAKAIAILKGVKTCGLSLKSELVEMEGGAR